MFPIMLSTRGVTDHAVYLVMLIFCYAVYLEAASYHAVYPDDVSYHPYHVSSI
jgi:hypothetical protein